MTPGERVLEQLTWNRTRTLTESQAVDALDLRLYRAGWELQLTFGNDAIDVLVMRDRRVLVVSVPAKLDAVDVLAAMVAELDA